MGTSAYRLDAFPVYEPAPSTRERRASVRAIRTGGATQSQTGTDTLVLIARMAAIVLVVVALLSLARITLTSAAVATMIESDTISAQIDEARSTGVSLEMQQSVLSSPTNIKAAVKRLGMIDPGEVEAIALEPDVVELDSQGNLSLSASVKNVVQAQE